MSSSCSNGGAGPSKMLTPPMCIGLLGPSMWRNEASIGLIHSIAAPSSSRIPGEHPVDVAMTDIPAVARVHLDVLGVRVQAGLPRHDAVASRVDRQCARGRGQRRDQVFAERRAAGAVAALAGEHPRDAQIAKPRHGPHRLEHGRADLERDRAPASRASRGQLTRSGLRTASTRASSPPRLCPIRTTSRPRPRSQPLQAHLDRRGRALAAVDVDPHAGGCRREPRRRSQPLSTPSDWSPCHESRHEQHGWRVPPALRREEPRIRGKPGELEPVTELSTQRGRRGKGRHAGSRNPGPGSGVTLCADISRPHWPHTSMGAAISPQSW